MFELDFCRPLWIVLKSGNIAVRPRGGQFSPMFKGNTRVEQETVTQVLMFLDPCLPPPPHPHPPSPPLCTRWPSLIVKRLMDVILLDSKCYPLLENDSTSGELYWRSTRKVLAANRSIYSKLTGDCTDLGNASVDATQEDTGEVKSSPAVHAVPTLPCYPSPGSSDPDLNFPAISM